MTPVQPLPGAGNQMNQNTRDRERRGKHTEFFGEPTAETFSERRTLVVNISYTVLQSPRPLGSWKAHDPTISL